MSDYLQTVQKDCINCKRCMKVCSFLKKYEITVSDFTKRQDLRYSCFMCKICKHVCPKDLDGSKVALIHRQNNPKGYGILKFEKTNYKFKNISEKKSPILLYLGCNFPRVYKDTTKYLIDTLERYGVDFAIYCCGKPLYESGDISSFQKNENNLLDIFDRKKVQKIVTLCPNCYYFFKERINSSEKWKNLEVLTIYSYMKQINIGNFIDDEMSVFHPCPDKESLEIFQDIKYFCKNAKSSFLDISCCGYGGLAMKNEKKLAYMFIQKIKDKNKSVYTYCASCSMNFNYNYVKNIHHILSVILGLDEKPSKTDILSLIEQKFYKKSR